MYKQYIYHKKFKDECNDCIESNIVSSVYCQCSNSNNNCYSVIFVSNT